MVEDDVSPFSPSLLEWVRTWHRDSFLHSSILLEERTLLVGETVPAKTLLMKIPFICIPKDSSEGSDDEDEDASLALHLWKHRHSRYRPYWESLPQKIVLPRDHPESFDSLLEGSPVIYHIQEMRKSLQQTNNLTLEEFAYVMAVVSSRAFTLPNHRSALIPLLDLCDHARGTAKNIAYEFDHHNNTIVTVRSIAEIPARTPLIISYGAKPNAVLLCNYGFCFPNNKEPDGSSNDTLEFANNVFLRTGGKAYTYGGFIKALQYATTCCDDDDDVDDDVPGDGSNEGDRYLTNDDGDDDDDMEAFLDDGDEHDEDYDDMYVADDSVELQLSLGRDCDSDIKALRYFTSLCDTKLQAYRLRDRNLQHHLESKDQTERYCAILIHSEQRILFFFRNAANAIWTVLEKSKSHPPLWGVTLEPEDQALLERQVTELVETYLQIRHPDRILPQGNTTHQHTLKGSAKAADFSTSVP